MLNVKIEGKTYEIKNSVEEFSIGEFETISSILNEEKKTKINKWFEIFVYLGIPEDVVDNFDSFAFIQLINEFNINEFTPNDFTKEIIINGYTYVSYDEEFKLTVKEMGMIESVVTNKNNDKYLADILAVIFKRTDLTKSEHFDKAHIKFKADLFRKKITADVAMPFLGFLSKRLINNAEDIKTELNG